MKDETRIALLNIVLTRHLLAFNAAKKGRVASAYQIAPLDRS
jgi:hypothetical protein